jgi:hypothetical protein
MVDVRLHAELAISLALMAVVVWFAFVPSQLEFSDTGFTIKFLFRSLHSFDWSDLHSYGPGENVFVIQFTGTRTFQILPQAYRRGDWRMLENFLSSRFPDKKVSNHRLLHRRAEQCANLFRLIPKCPSRSSKLSPQGHK